MATVYSYGGTNKTASTATVAPFKLGIPTNYSEAAPKNASRAPGIVYFKNGTCATNIDELIKIKSTPVSSVQDLKIPVRFPVPVKDGVRTEGELQAILRETRDDGTIYDHPIKVNMSIVTDVTAPFYDFTAQQQSFVAEAVCRLLGVFYRDDGTERFGEFAKGLIKPAA